MVPQNEKALRGYKRTKDPEGLAKLKNKMGDYNGAIRLLLKYNRIAVALRYAETYESANICTDECYRVKIIASEYLTEKLSNPGKLKNTASIHEFETVLKYVSPSDQVSYFKAAEMHDRACEVLLAESKYEEVSRIYKAQGWHDEGIQLARTWKQREDEEVFMLYKATVELESEDEQLSDSTIAILKKKWGVRTEREIRTSLVYGMGVKDYLKVWPACTYYKQKHNPVALAEAFNIALALAEYDEVNQKWKNIKLEGNDNLLDFSLFVCMEIRSIIDAFKSSNKSSLFLNKVMDQIESFYGFEKREQVIDGKLCEVYYIPSSSFPWTNRLLSRSLEKTETADADGMLQFKVGVVHKRICKHLEHFIKALIVTDKLGLVKHFIQAFRKHPLYERITNSDGYLTESLTKFSKTLNFTQFWKMLCTAFDIAHYGNTQVDSEAILKRILAVISPQATCYLPTSTLAIQSDHLAHRLQEMVSDVLAKGDQEFNFNEWYEAWRISCVIRKTSLQKMQEILTRRSEGKNCKTSSHTDSQGYTRVSKHQQFPHKSEQLVLPVYVRDRNNQFQHLMLQWIISCNSVRQRHTFPASTIAVYNIICHIAQERAIWNTVSVSNLLNITTIHSTAILIMLATCSLVHATTCSVYLPLSYKTITDSFHNMNAQHHVPDFYSMCMQSVWLRRDKVTLKDKLQRMLQLVLKVMIGLLNEPFNPLKYALSNPDSLQNHEAHHCLIFVFTLFCNIALISSCPKTELLHYRVKIYESVKHCQEPSLLAAYNRFAASRTLIGCIGVVRELLDASADSLFDHKLLYDPMSRGINIISNIADTRSVFQKELLPIPENFIFSRRTQVTIQAPASEQPSAQEPASATSSDSTPVPELQTLESVEADDDDFQVPQLQTDRSYLLVEKDPMVDDDTLFCLVCVSQLKPDSAPTTKDSESSTESYSNHCRSETHLTNSKLYKYFDDEEKDYYQPKKKTLLELKPRCESLYNVLRNDKLKTIIETIARELNESDRAIQEIRNSAEWRQGVTHLQTDLSGKLDSLEMKTKRVIEESELKKREVDRAKEEQKRKAEEEEEAEEELDMEEEEIAEAPAKSGQIGKKRSRNKKRSRSRLKK